MKRLFYGTLAGVLLLATAAPAFAGSKSCNSEYQNGELCYRHCDFYDDDGDWVGSITEEYQC